MTPEQAPSDGLAEEDVSTIIAMAWQDDTPFEAIAAQFGLNEQAVIELMRRSLKARSFRMWRIRVRGRAAKHQTRQVNAQRDPHQIGSGDFLNHGLNEAQDTFPLPPSPMSRESLI
jgi:uncharacterized protein (TIGR03643 family)